MFVYRIILCLIILFFSSCASSSTNREEKLLSYSEESAKSYEKYLVDPGNYTTKGAEHHQKYFKYLIGIATIITDEKKLNISEKTIGFYFDKKENSKNKLYLGLDLNVDVDPVVADSSYKSLALIQLEKYLKDIVYVVYSCRTVFEESDIIGTVIGIHWMRDNIKEAVYIWINQQDIKRFENSELTFKELIHRNYITDADGKIMKL